MVANLGRKKIVILGMMTKMPVAGVIWQNLHYLLGFQRLGYDVYYVEAHSRTPSMFVTKGVDDGSARAAAFVSEVMNGFDLGNNWAYHALHGDGQCFGMSEAELRALYESADAIINLHGGTLPLEEHTRTGRLVFLETDPVDVQIELHAEQQNTLEFLRQHVAFFTFGESYGTPACSLPVSTEFDFRPTRQPVVLDFWRQQSPSPRPHLTTIGNWKQAWRRVEYQGQVYQWSKHLEFLKFIDLPSRTSQTFELALGSYKDDDRRMLEEKGWRVRPADEISKDADTYRDFIRDSHGEFTVAKEQNIHFRTGWFSDRSATYLAAGRPVITQDTGFGEIFPVGAGLFAFSTMEDVLGAVEAINGDYTAHSRAASDIARDYFSHEVVLEPLLRHLGI